MPEYDGRFTFLLRREVILAIFVLSTVVVGLSDGASGGSRESWTVGILTILVYSTLAWFTHQRWLIATWATILVLLATGSGYLYDGFVGLTHDSEAGFLTLIVKALVGIYLSWGALIIHRERHLTE